MLHVVAKAYAGSTAAVVVTTPLAAESLASVAAMNSDRVVTLGTLAIYVVAVASAFTFGYRFKTFIDRIRQKERLEYTEAIRVAFEEMRRMHERDVGAARQEISELKKTLACSLADLARAQGKDKGS
jgi:hypothetical protein